MQQQTSSSTGGLSSSPQRKNLTPETAQDKARPLAFYLPQFHRIDENDEWWEPGFTEWTNTGRAKPLYPGHHQPRVPTELGYYDLTESGDREKQAQLAREYGIEGFCYWHYWFGNNRRLLERPFQEVLRSGEPDFPFALCWANESWTGVWHGAPRRMLMEQLYPGKDDFRAHFDAVLPAFRDPRYVKVDEKPVFVVYSPPRIPNPAQFIDVFRERAERAGLPGIYLIGMANDLDHVSLRDFDARMPFGPGDFLDRMPPRGLLRRFMRRLAAGRAGDLLPGEVRARMGAPMRFDYLDVARSVIAELPRRPDIIPSVMSGWDNTPRSGRRGTVFTNFSPNAFEDLLTQAVEYVSERPYSQRFIFIKAWNEWAEGNMLEPSDGHGREYLDVIRRTLRSTHHQEFRVDPGVKPASQTWV